MYIPTISQLMRRSNTARSCRIGCSHWVCQPVSHHLYLSAASAFRCLALPLCLTDLHCHCLAVPISYLLLPLTISISHWFALPLPRCYHQPLTATSHLLLVAAWTGLMGGGLDHVLETWEVAIPAHFCIAWNLVGDPAPQLATMAVIHKTMQICERNSMP